MNQSNQNNLLRFGSLLRCAGYGLLILSVFDLINALIPLRLMDSFWQLETLGQLVERVPVPLIGLVLVFYDAQNWPATLARWETYLLSVLSWGALLAGIGYLLLVPLGLFSTVTINRSINNQLKQEVAQGVTQIDSMKKQLQGVNTEAQMKAILNSVQGLPPEIREYQQLEDSKQKLTEFITKTATRSINQLKQTYFERRLELLKQSVKLNLGSLVSGVLFIIIWRMTEWARVTTFWQFSDDDE